MQFSPDVLCSRTELTFPTLSHTHLLVALQWPPCPRTCAQKFPSPSTLPSLRVRLSVYVCVFLCLSVTSVAMESRVEQRVFFFVTMHPSAHAKRAAHPPSPIFLKPQLEKPSRFLLPASVQCHGNKCTEPSALPLPRRHCIESTGVFMHH